MQAHHLRLQPDDLGSVERHILLHRPQTQASVLTLNLLRRCSLRGGRLTTDDVSDARDFVYLALDVGTRLVALQKRLRDGVERQKVDAALEATLLAKRRPFVHRDEGVVVAFGHQALERRLACVVHAAHPQSLYQSVDAVG